MTGKSEKGRGGHQLILGNKAISAIHYNYPDLISSALITTAIRLQHNIITKEEDLNKWG